MGHTTPDQAQAILDADPQLQQLVQQLSATGGSAHPTPQHIALTQQVVARIQQLVPDGSLPDGYGVNPLGKVTTSPGDFSPAILAALIGGSALGLGAVTGSLGAGGATAAGGGAAAGGGSAAAGGTLASSVIAPTSAALPAGAAGGIGAAAPVVGPAAAGGSTLTNILGTASRLAPVLGGAAAAESQANQIGNTQALADARFNLDAPAKRLSTAVKGALALAGPEKLRFNGPGSGLRGPALTDTGGFAEPLPENVKGLAKNVIDQQISDQLATPLTPNTGSPGDNLLGDASLLASLAGAFAPQTKKHVVPGQPSATPNVAGF